MTGEKSENFSAAKLKIIGQIMRGEIGQPKKPEKPVGYSTHTLEAHPLGLKPLRRSQKLVTTLGTPQWNNPKEWKPDDQKQFAYIAYYIRRYWTSTQKPKMRLSGNAESGVHFEISMLGAHETLITGPMGKNKYRKDLEGIFRLLSSEFDVEIINGRKFLFSAKSTFWN